MNLNIEFIIKLSLSQMSGGLNAIIVITKQNQHLLVISLSCIGKITGEYMIACLTALEARAISYLVSPEDWSIYTHIEVRIIDSIQHGGTSVIYAGKFNMHVLDALRALGYEVTILQYEGKERMVRIEWSHIMCPDSLICPKEIQK